LEPDNESAARVADEGRTLVDNAIRLAEAWRSIRRARPDILAAATSGIPDPDLQGGDLDTLLRISDKGESQMSTIAKDLHVAPSTATRAVDRLVERGLATRYRDPDDGRVVRIMLTDEGLRTQAVARSGRHAFAVRLLRGFHPEDRAAIAALMPKLAAALTEDFGAQE
jgi:DNA-binding MarR family transcriptional regulator